MVRNTLKPLAAVLMITPGICLCQCTSLISVCPMWINNNCGGMSFSDGSTFSAPRSTAKSQMEIWLSDPDAVNTELSVGCHSTDVIGALWCLNVATGVLFFSCRKSQTLITPSSPPETIKGSFLFHEMTLTSASCAFATVNIFAFDPTRFASQIRMDLSTEHEAKTFCSLGLH